MTEGGIATWKKKEGETFEAGDVLLEIVSPSHFGHGMTLTGAQETDKATMDVEAQDDGVIGKIIVRLSPGAWKHVADAFFLGRGRL